MAWLLSSSLYLYRFGVVTNLEAGKYILEAQHYISTGSFSAPRFWFYCITLFILIISLKLKIGLIGAFIIQAAINLLAYLLFFKAVKKVFARPLTAFLVILYLLFFWPYQSWLVFLYTESVFFSAILILIATIILYKGENVKHIAFIGLSLLIVLVSRPLGILFLFSVYSYFFYIANRKWKTIMVMSSLAIAVFAYYSINLIFSTVTDWSITQGFEQESIICDMPSAGPYASLKLANSGSPIYHLYYYVTHNCSHFLHFAAIKLEYFFLMTRPFYSKGHNYYLLFNLIPLYLLAVAGFFIRKQKMRKELIVFLFTTILLFTLTVIFQCDDYHSRFILSIFPCFVLLAAKTGEYLFSLFFKHSK